MGTIARERFLPDHTRPLAYVDRAVALGDGRFLAAPAVLGQLLTAMMPAPGQRALVVGAGTGYSAAVLGAMGLDGGRARKLGRARRQARASSASRWSKRRSKRAARSVRPYDQILIDGAVEHIPDADRRPACRGRPARRRAGRPRHHPADRRPQVGRRVRLSFAGRRGIARSSGLCPAQGIHFLRGDSSVP